LIERQKKLLILLFELYNVMMKLFLPLIIAFSILINPLNSLAEELILAGGCFWCLEHDLESLKGINSVESGYSGGDLQNPSYENHEGHQEVVLVNYDSQLVSLPEILRLYFRNIDPMDGKGQFCDRGDSYRPVIFFKDETEESDANNAIVSASNELRVPLEKISVELKSKGQFWLAEEYHQDFAERNELKYKFYRFSCGRDQRLDKLWGDNARSTNLWTE
jgi:peptide-methionine (S)-S-oxide reductase|tara:strand:+ start:1617 stop:2276 length:660 start_codon:yes stop_codon:yes gene_type:complete